MRRTAGLGEGKVGCILWCVVLVLAGLVAYQAIPVKLASTQLYDYMDDQARFGARTSATALKARVLKRAQELDLPVTPNDLTVTKTGGIIKMNCKFTDPVYILGYTYNWKFDLEVERQVFIF